MIVIVMGVSGSGKTTVGQLLATALQWPFFDADNFHPPANIQKMQRGIPLDDNDRGPWLEALRRAIAQWLHSGINVVLACSALKTAYRQQLCLEPQQIQWVYLKGRFEQIANRLEERQDHFMSRDLLKSQFEALEPPEQAVTVDIGAESTVLVREIRTKLGL